MAREHPREHLGWIALDLDGTITDSTHHAPLEVVQFLHTLQEIGWEIVFITGRTFSFAEVIVKNFDFPYYLAVQNGADILLMPERRRIAHHYLDEQILPVLEKAYEEKEEDFLLYAGYANGDFCYYRPTHFTPLFLEHVHRKIMPLSPEAWKGVENFEFEKGISFPLAKCLGTKETIEQINAFLQKVPTCNATMIRDPLGVGVYLILVTSPLATKGNAFKTIQQVTGKGGKTIAAGDDLNDISMLQVADVKIVMEAAPPEMHPLATIVAKHGKQHGIIDALNTAIRL